MKLSSLSRVFLCLLTFAVAARAADRIELLDGSVVLGKILSAEGGKFKVATAFAGTIEIAQDKIKTFSTDEAVNVAVTAGSTVLGKVDATDTGIAIAGNGAEMAVAPGKVVAVWRQGADSPETRAAKELAEKNQRKWRYEAALAINGRTGGSEKFAGSLGFKATLASAEDKLIFTAQAEKSQDNGVETANRQFGGVDYSAFISPENVWYVRTSLEKDTIKELDLRSASAVGFGHKLIKTATHDLEMRVGASYTYESYTKGTKFDSPGLDISFIHALTFKTGKLNNMIDYTPAFKNFSNYRLHHESSYEMPLAASLWKLKVGVANDYQSIPQPGVPRLDTLYFTSLILDWQ
jgi:hypothetical protein